MTSKFALRLPQALSQKLSKLWPVGAAFLIGGGAIAYLNFAQQTPRRLAPKGAKMVPQTALATLTVTTDELSWTKLRQFGTAETQAQFDGMLRLWKSRWFTENGYRYKQDIKPWIGDRVTLAILNDPTSSATKPSAKPSATAGGIAAALKDMVLVVPIADPLKAKSLLENGPQQPETDIARTYQGITVNTLESADGSMAIEMAVIGTKWLLLSNTSAGIEQAIDTYKGGRSLWDSPRYRKAATRIESPQPPGKNFAQLYLNLPAATRILATPSGSAAGPSARRSILPLQGSEGIVATALIEPEGVRFQGTSWLTPQNDLAYSELRNEAGDIPRRLPSDTLMMMSGSNLQQFWKSFSEGNTSPPFFPNPQNLKAGLLTQTGLDLEEDIMPWAAGEFALGLLPPARGDQPNPEEVPHTDHVPAIERALMMIMVHTNDRNTAESVWAQLDEVMASRHRFTVETETFEGGSLTHWISPFEGVQFSHGWLPGNVTFFTVGEGAASALVQTLQGQITPSPRRALVENRAFQTLTSQAPQPNNGHFYIDLAQINALDGSVFPLPQLSSDEGATAAIQAVGLTATVGDRAMDYDLYIKLAKGDKPKAL